MIYVSPHILLKGALGLRGEVRIAVNPLRSQWLVEIEDRLTEVQRQMAEDFIRKHSDATTIVSAPRPERRVHPLSRAARIRRGVG